MESVLQMILAVAQLVILESHAMKLVIATSNNALQKRDGYFNKKCFTSVVCVVTHSCN